MDDAPDTIDLEAVRRDLPVEYRGRVNRLGFREGIIVAIGLVVVLAGFGLIGLGPGGAAASPSASASIALASPGSVAHPSSAPSVVPSPEPSSTPAFRPVGRCLRLSTSVGLPWVTLLSGTERAPGANASESWLPEPPAEVEANVGATVPLGEPVILSVGYSACALEWRISAAGKVIEEQTNPQMDPAHASESYFVVSLPATTRTETVLRIDLHFTYGWTSAAWLISVTPKPVPDAFFADAGATVPATAGCGFEIRLRDGAHATETCGTAVPDWVDTLFVAPGSHIAFRVPAAVFNATQEARIACGHAGGSPLVLQEDPGCDVEIGYDPSEDYGFRAPTTAGVWLVEVTGCARRDAGEACGPWFVTIDTQNLRPSGSASVD